MNNYLDIKRIIDEAENIVFFGGAGVSTDSGIPDFRGSDGLYTDAEDMDEAPETILSHDYFLRKPESFYSYYKTHMIYPYAMTRVCKKLSMPKKAAVEAIAMFKMSCGETATAHDVFMAMQEIPYNLKLEGTPESKMLAVEENMARALTLNWREYDLATEVNY